MKKVMLLLSLFIYVSAFAENSFARNETQETVGFRVVNVKEGSLLKKMGLQKGDVITSFNNKPILTTKQAKNLYKDLNLAKTIDLLVQRNGKNVTLHSMPSLLNL